MSDLWSEKTLIICVFLMQTLTVYDIVSTIIYESSSDDMAISIGRVYNIGKITRDSFAKEAAHVGLCRKLAMQEFDDLKERFPVALQQAKADLVNQGFTPAEEVCDMILKRSY